jgi:hypothetical protein
MPITIRAAHAALIAAAVTAGVAACGSSAPVDPLASLSANQIMSKTMTDLKAASSVRFSGTVNDSGQNIAMDLTITKDGSCRGTMSESSTGTMDIVAVGQTVWFQMTAKFWSSEGISNSAEASELAGKYISLPENSSTMSGFSQLCSPSGLASSSTSKKNALKKGVESTIDGQKVLAIKDSADSAVAYVSDTAAPELIHLTGSGSNKGSSVDFTGYGDKVLITAPPSNEVIDGSKLGM